MSNILETVNLEDIPDGSGKDAIVARLKIFMRQVGKSQKGFADSIGANHKTLGNYMNGHIDKICSDALISAHEVHRLNINWLLCGTGGMFVLASDRVSDAGGDYGALPLIKINSDNAAELAEILDSVMSLPYTDLARLRQWIADNKQNRGIQERVALLEKEIGDLRKGNQ